MRKHKIKKLYNNNLYSPIRDKMIWKVMKMNRRMNRRDKETLMGKAKITKNKAPQ
jgi:hypothetical protein